METEPGKYSKEGVYQHLYVTPKQLNGYLAVAWTDLRSMKCVYNIMGLTGSIDRL